MSKDTARLYSEICEHARRTAALASINETLGWDERTHLPPAGGDYRAEQSTLLAGLTHQSWVDPKFGQQLDELAASLKNPNDPQDDAAVVVRRLKRQRDKRVKLPRRWSRSWPVRRSWVSRRGKKPGRRTISPRFARCWNG